MGEAGDIDGAEVVGEGGEQLGRAGAQLLLHVQHREQIPYLDLVVRAGGREARPMRMHVYGEYGTACASDRAKA